MFMNKVCKRWKFWGILLGLMLFAAGFSMHSTTVEVQAAPVNGFQDVYKRQQLHRRLVQI